MSEILEQKINRKTVLKFVMPSIIMMVIMSLYTVVDGTFVSRLIGTDAFSAVNIVYPLVSFVIALGTMFGTGLTAIVSIKLGEGRKKEARENLSFIIMFTIGLGIVIAILSFLFLNNIIYLLGANEAVYDYCYYYAFPLIFFFPANILQLEFQMLFVASGKPQIGLITTILGGLVNIFLDYFFIAVCKMGISGAAIATGIGYCIPALYGFFYFSRKKNDLYFVKPKIDWSVLWNSMTNGSSEMVSNLSGSITTFLFNIIMMYFIGQDGVAAISIILYLDFVLIAIGLGYSMGIAPLFSYNYGCADKEKIQKLYQISVKFCFLIGAVMTIGSIVFAPLLASVFTPKETTVYTLAVTGLKIYAFSYLFKCYNIFVSAMFTAFGNGKVSAALSFLRTLVFLVAILIGFSVLFGINGIWYATPVAELLALAVSIFFTIKYRKVYSYLL